MRSSVPQLQIADAAVRERVLTPSRSFIVQAPAGSGKTELLMQRYLTLLATVDEPESILAITFTRKAANEMRNRILTALERAASGDEPTEDHKRKTHDLALRALRRDHDRKWNLLDTPSRLQIRTVDSFCDSVARALPLGAGISVATEFAEDATPLYTEAARRTLLMLGDDDATRADAVGRLLLHLDNNFAKAQTLLVSMLGKREQWLPIVGQSASVSNAELESRRETLEAAIVNAVRYELRQLRETVEHCISAGDIRELLSYARYAANNCDDLVALAGIQSLPGTDKNDLAQWNALRKLMFTGDGGFRKTLTKATGFPTTDRETRDRCIAFLKDLAASSTAERLSAHFSRLDVLPPVQYSDSQWQVLKALFRVLPLAVAQLKAIFAEQSTIDFSECAQAALYALDAERNTEFALAWGERIRHILVDEFQDTSVLQIELLARLTAGWTPDDGNTLFVVGDPMQSIYGFRQAEVALFGQTRRGGLNGLPVESGTLEVNFRSQEPLIEWFNRTFPFVLTEENEITGAVEYSAATAIRRDSLKCGVELHPLVGRDDQHEAELVTKLVSDALEQNADGEIAILVRARAHLPAIARALTTAGICFRAVEIDPLAERQAVRDIDALARAILHVGDRVAWLSVLRAPWCGLDLADLSRLCEDAQAHTVLELLRSKSAGLSASGRKRVERVVPVLARAVAERGRVSVRTLVESTWVSLGGSASLRDESDRTDVMAYLSLLGESEQGRELPDRAAFEQKLARLFAPADTADGIRVQLMTIHGAKGLEFDTVIVPGLGRRPQRNTRPLLGWRELALSGGPQLLLGPIDSVGGDTDTASIAKYVAHLEHDRTREEAKRLLYVAATRAKRELHLIGHVKDEKRTAESDSLMQILCASPDLRATVDIAPVPEATEIAAEPERVPQQLRRLPLNWQLPSAPAPLRFARTEAESITSHEAHTFDWVGENLRRIGTVTHAFLERIGREGAERWSQERVGECAAAIRAQLRLLGMSSKDLDGAATKVGEALLHAVTGERGRWLLGSYPEAGCEVEISGVVDGKIVHVRIDRTFVVGDTRWVVDYKTSNNASPAFLDAQVEKYRPDLERYARLLSQADTRPIKAALYFPLVDEWREVPLQRSDLQ